MSAIHRIRRRASTCAADEAGFTMVEMVIAIFIFAMVIGGVVVGMSSSLNLTRQNRNRSIAANLAAQEMDTARSTDFVKLPLGMITTPQSVDGVPYVITRDTKWVTPSATSGPCQAPSGSTLAYLSIVVSVTWDNMAGVPAPKASTVVAPPVGTYDPNTGHIGVMVRSAVGAPAANVPVTISSPCVSGCSQSTSADGCAFFAFKPVGAYTVTLSKPGYVDDQLVSTPVQPATVGAGSTVSLQFQYDNAATINVTLAGGSGGVVPANVPVTLANTHLVPTGKKTFAGTGTTRSLLGLFPYADGLQTFAGDCLAADPEGLAASGAAIYPGASRQAATAVTPGGTSSTTVALHTAVVQTRDMLGAPRPNVAVTATNVTDTGCPTAVTYPLGSTDASGNLSVALPYGSWVVGASGTSSTVIQSLSPLDATTPTVTIQW